MWHEDEVKAFLARPCPLSLDISRHLRSLSLSLYIYIKLSYVKQFYVQLIQNYHFIV